MFFSRMLTLCAMCCLPATATSAQAPDLQEQARRETAKLQASVLEKAVKVYIIRNEAPPETLDDLFAPAKGGPFLQDKRALLDPWDKTYQYEVKGNGKDFEVKIWTKTPDGTVIDNSPKKK